MFGSKAPRNLITVWQNGFAEDGVYTRRVVRSTPVGISNSLYTYGPYCTELANDLDYVAFLKGVNVDWVPGIGGYSITPSENCDSICKKDEDFMSRYGDKIDRAVAEFGGNNARALELIATIVFVSRYYKTTGSVVNKEKLVEAVKEIKPKFSISNIEEKVDTLIAGQHITV